MFPAWALILATRESAGPDSKTLLCTEVVVVCRSPVLMWTTLHLFMTTAAMIRIMVMVTMATMVAMIGRLNVVTFWLVHEMKFSCKLVNNFPFWSNSKVSFGSMSMPQNVTFVKPIFEEEMINIINLLNGALLQLLKQTEITV